MKAVLVFEFEIDERDSLETIVVETLAFAKEKLGDKLNNKNIYAAIREDAESVLAIFNKKGE